MVANTFDAEKLEIFSTINAVAEFRSIYVQLIFRAGQMIIRWSVSTAPLK